MKSTEKDLQMFKYLSSGDIGANFVDYIDRLADSICDSRNWKEGDTRESTTKAAEYIKRNLRDKVALNGKLKSAAVNEYE